MKPSLSNHHLGRGENAELVTEVSIQQGELITTKEAPVGAESEGQGRIYFVLLLSKNAYFFYFKIMQ